MTVRWLRTTYGWLKQGEVNPIEQHLRLLLTNQFYRRHPAPFAKTQRGRARRHTRLEVRRLKEEHYYDLRLEARLALGPVELNDLPPIQTTRDEVRTDAMVAWGF